MIADLELESEDECKPEKGAALIVGPAVGDTELRLLEEMHRNGGLPEYVGAGVPLFVNQDEETGAEIWDDGQGAKWQKIMSWPREPTIAEAEAWKANAGARLKAAFWDRLQRARSRTFIAPKLALPSKPP
jgi:hypothetical protein